MRSNGKKRAATVPIFSLYGEQDASHGAEQALEFVHIEHIATRSQRHDWEIAPHAHRGLFQLLCVLGGGARVRLDEAAFELIAPAAIVIPPGVVHSFQFLRGTEGYVLTVAESLLARADAAQAALFEALRAEPRLVPLDGADVAPRIAGLLAQIQDEFRAAHSGRALMFDWLVRAVLLLVARRLSAAPLSLSASGRADQYTRFRALLDRHFAAHWAVPRYASALNLTESRLNRLCAAQAGKSAFELVQQRLLLEARRRLCYSAAPVSQLAYELGFSDPAYFCRFFKKHSGVAPSAFRRGGEGGNA